MKNSRSVARLKLAILIATFVLISTLKMICNPISGNQVQFTGVYALIAMISYTIGENTVEVMLTLKEPPENIPEKYLVPAVLLRLMLIAAAIHSAYLTIYVL